MKILKTTLWTAVGLFALAAIVAAPATADQVILDDLIVDGSLCVGFDCVNGESFGFDTIRLKENNTRIRAVDTSNTASFPTADWQLTFNDSSNGGADKFSIEDLDNSRTPFTIESGAPSHSLFVDDGGRIGLGTSTPVVEVHIKDGDTPTLRLEQDGSSGFTPQTWDVAGNETNFFIRDATNGSTLPFRIQPDAASNVLFLANDEQVGINTSSPEETLHINGAGQQKVLIRATDASVVGFDLQNNGNTSGSGTFTTRVATNGNVTLSRQGASPVDIQIAGSDGDVTIGQNLDVTGVLSKGSGAFRIDHPLDPQNRYLQHSFVESPDMMNIYNGNTALDDQGRATVELPEWFAALNNNYRYQLTAIGAPAPSLHVAQTFDDNNVFEIAGGEPGQLVSWQVTGVRADAFAEANRIQVELWKDAEDRGTYMHPEAFGQAGDRRVSTDE